MLAVQQPAASPATIPTLDLQGVHQLCAHSRGHWDGNACASRPSAGRRLSERNAGRSCTELEALWRAGFQLGRGAGLPSSRTALSLRKRPYGNIPAAVYCKSCANGLSRHPQFTHAGSWLALAGCLAFEDPSTLRSRAASFLISQASSRCLCTSYNGKQMPRHDKDPRASSQSNLISVVGQVGCSRPASKLFRTTRA